MWPWLDTVIVFLVQFQIAIVEANFSALDGVDLGVEF
jgi:hypothetical protein